MFKFTPNPLSSFFILLLLLSSFLMFAGALLSEPHLTLISYSLLMVNNTQLSFPILFDSYSLIFSATVMFISSNIMLFSMFYMKDEKFLTRFAHLVILFILSMNLLIFIPNIITVLIGWDGLGIISFILVIYYQNNKSLGAGMITALTNRIGDVLILLSIAMMFSQSHWSMMNMWNDNLPYSPVIIFLLLFAFCTKSAQIPFSAWLPAAMAAPTPVSALVHSSTLVTAGIYLLFRFYPFLSSLESFNLTLMIMSMSTMLMAGMAALVENDMKKIIALSTLSQLGVMIAAISMNMIYLAFFHLIAHALFKALLFICAGIFINFHLHGQDLRSMGNIFSKLPISSSAALLANLALCGLPFLAGFYSKDAIIENMLLSNFNLFSAIMFMLATLLTAAYSFRFIIILFNQYPLLSSFSSMNDTSITRLPLTFMSLSALTGGAVFSWILIYPTFEPIIPLMLKFLTPFIISTGLLFGVILSYPTFNPSLISYQSPHSFLTSMWSLTPLSTQSLLFFPYKFSLLQLKLIDQGWYEFFGPNGLFSTLSTPASFSSSTQNLIFNFSIFTMLMMSSLATLF